MMQKPGVLRATWLIAGLVLLQACSAAPTALPLLSADGLDQNNPPPVQVAILLLKADAASRQGDAGRAGLLDALYALDQLGAHGMTEDDTAIEVWRANIGAVSRRPDQEFRGRLLGPAYTSGVLTAGQNVTINQVFMAGRDAAVAVSTTQTPPSVRMTVRNTNGGVTCKTSPQTIKSCSWVPLFTNRYEIELENTGAQQARFYLAID